MGCPHGRVSRVRCDECMNTPPDYRTPEDPDQDLMDLFRRYDELTKE